MSNFTQCEAHEPISTPHCPICLLDERDSLRQKLEQAEARCAELESENESLWETFVKVSDYLGIDNEAARKIPGKPSSVFCSAILRKQAEAVEAAKKHYNANSRIPDGTLSRDYAIGFAGAEGAFQDSLDRYAQRLRQQADELEKESGQ